MAAHGRKNVDDVVVLTLAGGASIAQAAEQAKCSESTVRRRLADPAFRTRVHDMRGELVQAAVGRLAMLGTAAADELQRLIANGKDDNVKLGAARAVLGYMLSGHGNETLARQVEELRQQIEELERNGTCNNPQRSEASAIAGSAADGQGSPDPGQDPQQSGDPNGMSRPDAGQVADAPTDDEDSDLQPLFG